MVLYDAIMALGRSLDDIRGGHWICGTIETYASGHRQNCANGLVTLYLGASGVAYPTEFLEEGGDEETLRFTLEALIKTAPEMAMLMQYPDEQNRFNTVFENFDGPSIQWLQDRVIGINDAFDNNGKSVLTDALAAQWFSDAIDLLAKQLPDPLPPTPPARTQKRVLVTA